MGFLIVPAPMSLTSPAAVEDIQDATGASVTDSANIDFTYNDAGNQITADLINTAVTPGSYTNTNLTVDSKGRITAASSGGSLSFPLLASPVGSESAPAYSFLGDSNTGMSAAVADTLVLSSAGLERLKLTPDGTIKVTPGISPVDHGFVVDTTSMNTINSSIVVNDNRGNSNGTGGGVWYLGTRSGATQLIGFRASLSGSVSGYSVGSYFTATPTNSNNDLGLWSGSTGGNISHYGYASTGHNSGMAMGMFGLAYDSKTNVGAQFFSVDPRDVVSATSYGLRGFASGKTGSVNPIKRVGLTGWIAPSTSSTSTTLERYEPSVSAGGVFSNTTSTDDILVCEDNTTPVFRIKDGGQVQAIDGTSLLPSYSFNSDPDSGIWSRIGNEINFSTGGTEKWRIDSTGNLFSPIGSSVFLGASGNLINGIFGRYIRAYASNGAGDPSYSFDGDSDTGMYRASPDTIEWSTGGLKRLRLDTASPVARLTIGNSTISNTVALAFEKNLSSDQTHIIFGDGNTLTSSSSLTQWNGPTGYLRMDNSGNMQVGSSFFLGASDGGFTIGYDESVSSGLRPRLLKVSQDIFVGGTASSTVSDRSIFFGSLLASTAKIKSDGAGNLELYTNGLKAIKLSRPTYGGRVTFGNNTTGSDGAYIEAHSSAGNLNIVNTGTTTYMNANTSDIVASFYSGGPGFTEMNSFANTFSIYTPSSSLVAQITSTVGANQGLLSFTPSTSRIHNAFGSETIPSYSFASDNNTGMYSTGVADELAFSTGGTRRLKLDSSGDATFNRHIKLTDGNDVQWGSGVKLQSDNGNNRLFLYGGDGSTLINQFLSGSVYLYSPSGNNGHLAFGTDGVGNIGNTTTTPSAYGSNRPKNIFSKNDVYVGDATTNATLWLGASASIKFASGFNSASNWELNSDYGNGRMFLNHDGNVVHQLGRGSFGGLWMYEANNSLSSAANVVKIGGYDVAGTDGRRSLAIGTEEAVVAEAVTSDATLAVTINGTTYKILLKS